MRTPCIAVVVAICALSGTARAAQQPPADTGTLTGRLTSADLAGPIRKAQVKLATVPPYATITTVSDAEGRFTFNTVWPGDYVLSAAKPGYLEMALGARRPGPGVPGTLLTIAAGQKLDVSFALPRAGVITGVVTDEFGDPAMGVPVRAMRFAYSNGQRIARPAGNAATDDLGAYRIPGLMPGDYVVAAVPRDTVASRSASAEAARLQQVRAAGNTTAQRPQVTEAYSLRSGYVPSYYGATSEPSAASPVRLGLSEQATAVDIQLVAMKTGTVSGVVTGADGTPTMASVQLVDPSMPIAELAVWFRHPGTDGRFSFAGLVPGDYVLRAQATKAVGQMGNGEFTATLNVQVPSGGDADGSVTLRRGVSVAGVLDVTALKPTDLSRLRVGLSPITGPADWESDSPRVSVDAEGRFTITPVAPGPYRVVVSGLPSGWIVESARFGGIDAADSDLDVKLENISGGSVRLTSRPGELAGVVTNAENEPVRDRSVVLFPADRDLWLPQSRRIHVAQPGPDGRYVFSGLPAGDYRIAAVDPPESGEHFSAEYLGRIASSAVSVTLAAGAKVAQDIRVR